VTSSDRNYLGYGRHEPRVEWPGGERVVVNLVLNYEEGAEYTFEEDGRNDPWSEGSEPALRDGRDLGIEAYFEFGSRVGVWRLARLFDRYEVPITVNACAVALERNPEVSGWISERADDVMGHGWKWRQYYTMDRESEEAELVLAMESFARLGHRPLGWNARDRPSVHALELLVAHGFLYSSDPANDELPYVRPVGGKEILVIPYSHVYNDSHYLDSPSFSSPRDFAETLKMALDYLCEDVANGAAPRMMTVALHARISGQAGRTAAVRQFIQHVAARSDASFMRRSEIAQWWLDHAPAE
jgi:peptidoglycan/xylan/chitin deacetylase (PgdA/CDA1 family)